MSIETGIELPAERFVFTPPPGMKMTGDDPAAPKRTGVMMQSSSAVLTHEVPPEYTAEARAAGLQGAVSLYVEVDNDGHPGQVRVMQGLGLGLDEMAVEAVRQWEYGAKSGSPGEVQTRIGVDVQFRLDPPGPWSVASEYYSVNVPHPPEVQDIVKPVPVRYQAPDSAACQAADRPNIKFTIGTDGIPRDVSGASDAAASAVRTWRFVAATVNGSPAESYAEAEFECRPQGMILQSEIPPPPVYRVGGGIAAPTLLLKTEPEYSEEARRAKLQGKVTVAIQVGTDGRTRRLKIIDALGSGLDQKAMEAIKRWRFSPAMKDGKPVTIEATVEVNFRLL
jgi:TonB family protein